MIFSGSSSRALLQVTGHFGTVKISSFYDYAEIEPSQVELESCDVHVAQ